MDVIDALLVVVVSAQLSSAAPDPTPLCWRARPADTCRSWVVTETSLEMPLFSTYSLHPLGVGVVEENEDFGGRVTFTGGMMVNRSPKTGVGFTATLSLDDADELLPSRVEGRYRRWTGQRTGVDLSLGLARRTIRGADGIDSIKARGITASAGVSNTYFGIDARADLMRGDGRPVTGVFLGVRSGSRAGPIVAVSGFVLLLAAFAALTGPNY